MSEPMSERLPRTVMPHTYQLELTPDLLAGRFDGKESITIEVAANVKEIVLNAVDLTIHHIVLHNGSHRSLIGTLTNKPEAEQVVLSFEEEIVPGQWTLSMEFEGALGDDLRGFYRTVVQDDKESPVVIASTQCEATDARRIFPCWDEPDFKATFVSTLVVDPQLTALSNAPEIGRQTEKDGKQRIQFAETIPMSTYLVAFVVGPLALTDPISVGNIPVRVAARTSLLPLTAYAQGEAARILDFFQAYFHIDYPAEKLDHVAIPDFAAGAMENLGCITYREEALLIDPQRSSPMEKLNVVSTIAHETAHMWFGDMVTMRWWNGLWLNEAFATFMQWVATDALHPEWDVWTIFGLGRATAFVIDGLAATRPIEYPVHSPAEAQGMFDTLTYDKGAAVLRMVEEYLGPEVFRTGVSAYLNRYRYGNTETNDLWNSLGEAAGQPLRDVMDSWIFQGGYPLITAKWDAKQHHLSLSQKPFRYQGKGQGLWAIPVVLGIHRDQQISESLPVLLTEESMQIDVPPDTRWVTINQGGWGFYRAAYDAFLWQQLTAARENMTALERMSIVDDVWAAVLADEVPLAQAVALWRTFHQEHEPDIWNLVMNPLMLLDKMADEKARTALQRLVQEMAQPVFSALTWESHANESVKQARLRAALIPLLGIVGADEAVRQEAVARFAAHIQGTALLDPALQNAVIRVAAAQGDEAMWEEMYRQYKKAATPQDAVRYLYALMRFPDPQLVSRAFDLCLSAEVRVQDGLYAIGEGLRNRYAEQQIWDRIEKNWQNLLKKYPAHMMESVVNA
ncbi:MAG: M1 family metallopeptidase, partial [Firmicutes bacterium]|nr:M1 family metallopeptidase [Bacillota bacterium]